MDSRENNLAVNQSSDKYYKLGNQIQNMGACRIFYRGVGWVEVHIYAFLGGAHIAPNLTSTGNFRLLLALVPKQIIHVL